MFPPLATGRTTEDQLPVLLWVHTGTATIEAAGTSHVLTAGEALWVPAGTEHGTRTEAGAVVLPILPSTPALPGAPADVRVVRVPDTWADWLVSQFDFNRHHTQDEDAGALELLALVAGEGSGAPELPSLTMPSSRQARAVAEGFLRSPADLVQVSDLAARENVSLRTLQRQFHDETGLPLSEWRTRARVTVAASLLADGREIGWAARDVGFQTSAGFTRAFRRHVGVAPKDYPRSGAVSVAPALERQPPPVPPRRVWNWVYDWHVLWWVYRGEVAMRIGTRQVVLRAGQAVWIPAGCSASVDERGDGSILLPLGNRRGGAEVAPADLRVLDLQDLAVPYLLHTVVAEYTLFEPVEEGDREALADVLFEEQFGHDSPEQDTGALTGAVAVIARSLRLAPADPRSLAEWAETVGEPVRRLGHEFVHQTGRDFPRWRADVRMSLARELLRDGSTPLAASRVLGYATSAGFGQVFTATHGLTPRQYQQRVVPRQVASSA
ncbi:helix-turn-helix domain-containing protein [Aeromicrobium choanae]|uniref:AraC-type DNA-binding protein n=1 Tax=Aeromicrobium choanae TaxID=1736691 RepID=A0A1T4YQX9_9ACTN|nr:helix-turn-helix domain-containing protein [Aeromicrobium choanae]SKB04247.1 AraC-type DNA-binding protein [Aeromicrobium choanae]